MGDPGSLAAVEAAPITGIRRHLFERSGQKIVCGHHGRTLEAGSDGPIFRGIDHDVEKLAVGIVVEANELVVSPQKGAAAPAVARRRQIDDNVPLFAGSVEGKPIVYACLRDALLKGRPVRDLQACRLRKSLPTNKLPGFAGRI